MTTELRTLVAAEVKRQLDAMRISLKKEILEELKLNFASCSDVRDVKANLSDVDKKMTNLSQSLVKSSSQQLALREDIKNELASIIKTTIVPRIESLTEMVNYHTEDANLSVHEYRMGVNRQSMPLDHTDNRVISHHVRTAWGEEY